MTTDPERMTILYYKRKSRRAVRRLLLDEAGLTGQCQGKELCNIVDACGIAYCYTCKYEN